MAQAAETTFSKTVKVCRGVLMIRPTAFAFNEAAAVTNAFQTAPSTISSKPSSQSIVTSAIQEFDDMVTMLRKHHIIVVVVEGNGYPDEVFPNNWLVFLDRPQFATFPMCAETRRRERDKLAEILACVNEETTSSEQDSYDITQGIDFGLKYEEIGKYMEGTGSIVFDHKNRFAYACLSPRTDEFIVREVCSVIDYTPILFTSRDEQGILVYHTNVLMSIGNEVSFYRKLVIVNCLITFISLSYYHYILHV